MPAKYSTKSEDEDSEDNSSVSDATSSEDGEGEDGEDGEDSSEEEEEEGHDLTRTFEGACSGCVAGSGKWDNHSSAHKTLPYKTKAEQDEAFAEGKRQHKIRLQEASAKKSAKKPAKKPAKKSSAKKKSVSGSKRKGKGKADSASKPVGSKKTVSHPNES